MELILAFIAGYFINSIFRKQKPKHDYNDEVKWLTRYDEVISRLERIENSQVNIEDRLRDIDISQNEIRRSVRKPEPPNDYL